MTERTDDDRLADISSELLVAVESAIGPWVERCIRRTCVAADVAVDERVQALAADAARRCRSEVVAQLEELLATDIDDQRRTPLQVVRAGVRHPTAVLAELGIAPLERDDFDRRSFPDDLYELTPAGFGDVDPSLVGPAIAWGAAKTHIHLARHRPAES